MTKQNEETFPESSTQSHKSPFYSQLGAISDPSLGSLRDHIKKVMIPMLIKIFQLKLELSQSISLPSRLQPKSKESPEQITAQLKSLDEDLHLLRMWCDSARNQVAKALNICEEEQKTTPKATVHSEPYSSVAKSFSDALSAQSSLFKAKEKPRDPISEVPPASEEKKTWWKQFFS